MYHLSMWALIAGLVLMNAFFVAAEFALVKVRASQLLMRAKKGSLAARTASKLVSRLDECLSAAQLGITVASLGLGWIGEPYIARLISNLLEKTGLLHATQIASHAIAFTVALAIISGIHLVWGELAPKNLAIAKAERTALFVAIPFRAFQVTFYPFITFLNELANASLRAVGIEPAGETELALSEEELRLAFAQAYRKGHLTKQEQVLMENVLRFTDMRARQVMVPRTEIVFLSTADSLEECVRKALESGHTRLPLIEEDLDHVLGYVHIKDLARLLVEPRPWQKRIEDFCRPVDFLSEHIKLGDLLLYFQRHKAHLVILVDEYGGTAGMATLENVLEQLVGSIQDEFDSEQPLIRRVGRDRYLIDGRCPIALVEARCGVTFGRTEADTVGGLVIEKLGEIPSAGQRVRDEAFEIVVTEADEKRVIRVELLVRQSAPGMTI